MDASRKRYMDEVQDRTKLNKDHFLEFCRNLFGYDLQFKALERRVNTVSVRSTFTKLVYTYLMTIAKKRKLGFRKLTTKQLDTLAFLTDAYMSVMYAYNHVYDHKLEIRSFSKKAISQKMNNANQLANALFNYIQETSLFSLEQERIISMGFNNALREVDKGQRIDCEYNFINFFNDNRLEQISEQFSGKELLLVQNIIEELKLKYDSVNTAYFETYFSRIYLLNSGLLREVVNMIIKLTSFSCKDERNNIMAFAELYGMLLQVVNDVNDFVYDRGTSNKAPADTLSDLKNNTVTLPIMLHMMRSKGRKGLVNKYIKSQINPVEGQGQNDIQQSHNRSKVRPKNANRNAWQKLQSFIASVRQSWAIHFSSSDHAIITNCDPSLENKQDKKPITNANHPLNGHHNEAMRELIESGAMDETREIAKKIAKIARALITTIKGRNNIKSPSALLRDLTSIVDRNRYFVHLDAAKAAYARGDDYRTEDHPSRTQFLPTPDAQANAEDKDHLAKKTYTGAYAAAAIDRRQYALM
ncbi:MAG: polyprenyl synthetase family protein [Bacteroidota bacterium]